MTTKAKPAKPAFLIMAPERGGQNGPFDVNYVNHSYPEIYLLVRKNTTFVTYDW